MVHKALELLAQRKLAEQKNEQSIYNDELKKTILVSDLTVERACMEGFVHYKSKNESNYIWTEKELNRIKELVDYTLSFNDGMFSPLKRKILAPEQFFDFEINEPWAYYDFVDPHDGKKINGYLRVRGTIDLVTEVDNGVVEYIDWKTGARKNWATGEDKDYKKLRKDPQLMLYFYALTRLYPEAKAIFVTIFFCQSGGPFSIFFDKQRDIPYTLALIKNKFEAIKNDYRPKRIWDNKQDRYKICKSWCGYGKTMESNGKSQCENLYEEMVELGLDRLVKKYGKKGDATSYTGGGTTRETSN